MKQAEYDEVVETVRRRETELAERYGDQKDTVEYQIAAFHIEVTKLRIAPASLRARIEETVRYWDGKAPPDLIYALKQIVEEGVVIVPPALPEPQTLEQLHESREIILGMIKAANKAEDSARAESCYNDLRSVDRQIAKLEKVSP